MVTSTASGAPAKPGGAGVSPEETATLRGLAFSATGMCSVSTLVVVGRDVVGVEALAQEQLPAEAALGPLGDGDLVALGPGEVALGGDRERIHYLKF